MKYMILIHTNPAMREFWDSLSDDERAQGFEIHNAFREEIDAAGELVAAEALADASLTKRITVRDGRTLASDGPFGEAKELLAGFYLVDCDTVDRAVELAGRLPEAEYGTVEVRPVLDLGGQEM